MRNKTCRAIACIICLLAAPHTVRAAQAAQDVMLGYANISARVSPLWLAREKGFFSKYGVQLQAVYMPGAPALFATLATGQIQLANSGGSTALGAVVGGLDLKVIGTFTSRIPFDIVASSSIKDGKDLRGKRLGIQAIGGTIWMAGLLGLEYLGLDPRRDSIQVVAAGELPWMLFREGRNLAQAAVFAFYKAAMAGLASSTPWGPKRLMPNGWDDVDTPRDETLATPQQNPACFHFRGNQFLETPPVGDTLSVRADCHASCWASRAWGSPCHFMMR